MSFEEDDEVVLHDKHSDYDGEQGTITQVMETMFGDATYTVSFEDGQEAGVPEESLEAADTGEDDTDEDEANGSVVDEDEADVTGANEDETDESDE